jgi:aspartate/methionine/tyrosine aminotransferase
VNIKDPLEVFELKPVRAAKVSEISEATALSPVPPEERVNFHIGNPVQDSRLSSAYLRLSLGIDITDDKFRIDHLNEIAEYLNWPPNDKSKLEFLSELIKKSSPYSPRGGFMKTNPPYAIQCFNDWLIKNQQEPLAYDLGEKTGRREIILASGGLFEALRVFFHSLSDFIVNRPVKIFLQGINLPEHLKKFTDLEFEQLAEKEPDFVAQVYEYFSVRRMTPTFLVLGKSTTEETRRQLRLISLRNPLFFVEVNDAPNHLSLAREAKMMNRVLRFITPGVINQRLKDFSLIFIVGNSDFINVLETVHFQLKGTPSSTEIELLGFLLKNLSPYEDDSASKITTEVEYEGASTVPALRSVSRLVSSIEDRLNKIVEDKGTLVEKAFHGVDEKAASYLSKLSLRSYDLHSDRFLDLETSDFLEQLIGNIDNDEWINELSLSYLTAFLNHHPEYRLDSCLVISGSSRTVLSLLGFHCGFNEVVIPDLSWTYEHCFPKVLTVSLTPDFQIDVDSIISVVESNITTNPDWKKHGAVILNNPHNATGQIFDSSDLVKLLRWLLERKIFVIDDLSYQNVKPSERLEQIPTIRQLANDLVSVGYIGEEESNYVITVHSVSKTDSYAGARLSVVEIRHEEVRKSFGEVSSFIRPNVAAIALAYLFYRNRVEDVNAYYRLRNRIFKERSEALLEAVKQLPKERNQFDIKIDPPVGSMYPRMVVSNLPSGLSLDWLASGLARQGIGLVPLSTFARTEMGFDAGRKTFRLTLGGTDGAETLAKKTRRVLIDLNRLIAEESANYNRREFKEKNISARKYVDLINDIGRWNEIEKRLYENINHTVREVVQKLNLREDLELHLKRIRNDFLPFRVSVFRNKFEERRSLTNEIANLYLSADSDSLTELLEREFYKDDLKRRKQAFRYRLFDRTVHPTQMYSIKVEMLAETIIDFLIHNKNMPAKIIDSLKVELVKEYFGLNVAIASNEEPQELILDLNTMTAAEDYLKLHSDCQFETFLSFWGDWDGSNRPSGQGHSLVAAVLMKNVVRQANIVQSLVRLGRDIRIDQKLLAEIEKLPISNKKFSSLLIRITLLTHQLEKRFRGTLPVNVQPGRMRRLGMKIHLAKDPLTWMWQHNDRLERKMLELRKRRKETLEYYFSLNKQLRKTLYSLIPKIKENLSNRELLLEISSFRDMLKRFVVTPRIHQKLITAQDQFAIDTTVHNINEINEISGKYGNPGLVLALQVSMATKPEPLISLDRKLRSKREEILREGEVGEIPDVWIVPLFEDIDSVKGITDYLNKVWDYAFQSRRLNQETSERFAEIISEVFVAGSDLSQQVGQAMGMNLYLESKYDLMTWLSSHNLTGKVRMKMGSGEPMQRQGGYYSSVAGKPLFIKGSDSSARFSSYLKESTRRSTFYATTPLMGIFSSGDLRTFQSNLFEKCRQLNINELAQLFYHIKESQTFYQSETFRASEPLSETRLQFKTRGLQELERLTIGRRDNVFNEFLSVHKDNFRHILYGRDEDVMGIHIVSYFIGRATPPLRDRPTARPGQEVGREAGQEIIQRIARTIPLSKYGSLLRAISHNQAQTVVLGINQLTTGLFRALDNFSEMDFTEGESSILIADHILPRLPVYEMLHTLRIYQDVNLTYLNKIEKAFPAGNSALIALREDIDSMRKYLPLFQKELLRRHGLDVSEFFMGDTFIPDLLPTVRPDIAVLLQKDIFNTDSSVLLSMIGGNVSEKWLADVQGLLQIPAQINSWRSKIWGLLEKPVFQRVSSFAELAVALYSLSLDRYTKEYLFDPKRLRVSHRFVQPSFDDSMQEFLSAALEYLTAISQSMVEVPVGIIRALKEAETIIKIEEQALEPREQDLLRFYLLQIARLTGENG